MTRAQTYTSPMTLRLTPADHAALVALAAAEGTTSMAIVRRAIRREIERATGTTEKQEGGR